MSEATLTKAATYRNVAVPAKVFHFAIPQEVTEEEEAILAETGYFKFSNLEAAAPVAGEAIDKPKGGVVIRTKIKKVIVEEGVEV